jgi:Reverse transcriptase (RNA-dependent DNA polymerase)
MSEIYARAQAADKKRITGTLLGGSAKRLTYDGDYIGMPTAVTSTDGDSLVTDPELVKSTTKDYWSKLYKQQVTPDVPKPWLSTPSVLEVRRRVDSDPFQWPVPCNIADFRAMLRRGNHRPAPGPDEWEKWCIKNLSDFALSLVLDLHNYQVMNSKFPGNVKDMWLTYIHKRGIRTDLVNYRGLMLSNFLANSPMTWLNYKLVPYVARLNVIPDTQVATQQGVQTRDVMSYLSSVKTYAERHHQTIYALQRDQMKGFDYLAPSGFYDALKAYGFPEAICDLDRAAQTQTKAYIRTAYGITGPIIVNGLTKQGGPLSPIKSTFTTSLGHRYLDDLASSDSGALVMSTKALKTNNVHTPDDRIQARVTMVEATDDSYLFALTLTTLRKLCLEAERFQYAYGWLTQWSKTKAFVICPDGTQPPTILMPSITVAEGVHPWTVSNHDVPLKPGELEFLRAKVDDPGWRYQGLKDFIETYKFPKLTTRIPITLLRKITAQCIIARCRALLSIQPIKNSDAHSLDKQIARKIHLALGFPYQGNTDILNLPIEKHGMDFPSIARINMGLVTEGLARDLNHHIPAYRQVAHITLADWTCSINNCVGPLDGLGLRRNFTQYYKKIPAAWIIAQSTLTHLEPKLSLRRTDASHILRGDVSISHSLRLCQAHGFDVPGGHAIRSITTKGIRTLSDAGEWSKNKNGKLTFAVSENVITQNQWTPKAREHWDGIANTLRKMDIVWLFEGDPTLITPRTKRQTEAENYIRNLPAVLSLPPSSLPHQNRAWGSDGSMIPATSGVGEDKSVIAAITGAKTIVVRLNGRSLFILHGELMGLIMGLILSDNGKVNNKLFTDHLNSARFIGDARTSIDQGNCLRSMNGRSYYRWIMDLVRRIQTEVVHTKAHTDQVNLPSLLNAEADHYASKAQEVVNSLHTAPIPTFFMDDYTFYRPKDGWIESNIRTFIEFYIAQSSSLELQNGHHYRMATWLYDPRPPPMYPYVRATAAYSAVIQWYARSGQLPTATAMKERDQGDETRCRMGCSAVEDPHHVFVLCKAFGELRNKASKELMEKTRRRIEATELEEAHFEKLLRTAKLLFSDCPDTWPLHYSFYYLGHIPKLDNIVDRKLFTSRIKYERFLHNTSSEWHMSAIRLTSRIWGAVQREMARRRDLLNVRH